MNSNAWESIHSFLTWGLADWLLLILAPARVARMETPTLQESHFHHHDRKSLPSLLRTLPGSKPIGGHR